MKVIVDSCVWSFALRRNQPESNHEILLLKDLIADARVVLMGVVRQEILSGLRHAEQFNRLQDSLRAFPNLELTIADYELAAEFFNCCRSHGVQGSNTDFLICAAAVNRNYSILTTDQDFKNFRQYLSIQLIT